nr:MAG: ORF1 [TTV-like mini virus]
MPNYWRYYWPRRRRQTYRRRLRGPRKTFRRRWRLRRTRRRRVRRYKNYKKYFKKAKKITLKQFQPDTIKRCKIKGFKCLFQGGSHVLSRNYIQYIESIVPEHWDGGGGWGLLVLSLGALFEDWEHLRNIWTVSNVGLPLVKYRGAKLIFYQSPYTDYVVTINTCWPMTDTELTHANSCPQRMLLARKKHIIPSLLTRKLPKNRIKIRVPPPAQMQTKWYFSKDICNTPLMLITATSCSLTHYYLSPRATSNNITVLCLNTELFQRCDFQHPSATEGYKPKDKTYLYSTHNATGTIPTDYKQLVYLGNSKDYQEGQPGDFTTLAKWGNPFHEKYINKEYPLFYSSKKPSEIKNNYSASDMNIVHTPILIPCRYNPEKDTGLDNLAYIVDNYRRENWEPTGDPHRDINGFPLWVLLWGWTDWLRKLGNIPRLNDDHIVVIKTKMFDTKMNYYIPLSLSFRDGKSPYGTEIQLQDYHNWYPKLKFQEEMLEIINQSGPGVAKPPSENSVEAKMLYTLYFSWGGCPKILPEVKDPCLQPKWPTADTQPSSIEIENPITDPKTQLYKWDWRRDELTEPATKRLKKTEKIDDLLLYPAGTSHWDPIPKITKKETSTPEETSSESEEEEKTPRLQLLRIRKHQRLLKYRILQLASKLKTTE